MTESGEAELGIKWLGIFKKTPDAMSWFIRPSITAIWGISGLSGIMSGTILRYDVCRLTSTRHFPEPKAFR